MAELDPSTLVCDLGAVAPSLGAIDALARLQLNARRLGLELDLRHASNELSDLIAFAGLDEVLCVEARRQAEEGEQRRRCRGRT